MDAKTSFDDIVNKVLILSKDGIEEHLAVIEHFLNRVPKYSGVDYILKEFNVQPVQLRLTLESAPPKAPEFLGNYTYSSIPKQKNDLDSKMYQEMVAKTATFHFMRVRNTLFALILSDTNKTYERSSGLRYLRGYLQHAFESGWVNLEDGYVADGFNERGGDLSITSEDCLVVKRMLICLNAYLYEIHNVMPAQIILELLDLMIHEPYPSVMLIKKHVWPLFCSAGCKVMNPQIIIPSPDEDIMAYTDAIRSGADIGWLSTQEELIKEAFSALEMLPTLLDEYKILIEKTDPFTDEDYDKLASLQFPEGMFGYMFTNRMLTFMSDLEDLPPISPNDTLKSFTSNIKRYWSTIIEEGVKDDKMFNSNDKFVADVYNSVSSKSAGNVGEETSIVIPIMHGGKELNIKMRIKSRDKNYEMYVNPGKYLSHSEYQLTLTDSSPGYFSIRTVPARKTRKVSMIPINNFIADLPLAKPAYSWVLSNSEVAVHNVGKIMIDYFNYNKSGSLENRIYMSLDFSGLDLTLRSANERNFIIEAINEASAHTKLNNPLLHMQLDDGTELTWPSIKDVMEQSEIKLSQAKFIYPDGKVRASDQNLSGEYKTMVKNTISSMSFLDTLSNLTYIDFMLRAILGDDILTTFDPSRVYIKDLQHSLVDHLGNVQGESLSKFQAYLVKLANECGLEVNVSKSIIRRYMYEFLKVPVLFGRFLSQQTRLNLLSAENDTSAQNVIEIMKGYKQRLNTWVARGGEPRASYNLLVATWIIKRGIRIHEKGMVGSSRIGYYPFYMLYAPISFGGIGCLPFTVGFANADALMAAFASGQFSNIFPNYREFYERVRDDAEFVGKPGKFRDRVAKAAISQGTFSKGIKMMTSTLDESKLREAYAAIKWLTDRGHRAPKITYPDVPTETIRQWVKDTTVLKVADKSDKYLISKGIRQHRLSYETILHPRVRGVNLTFEMTACDIFQANNHFNALPVVCDELKNIYYAYGYTNVGVGAMTSPIEVIYRSIRKSGLPRVITPERVMKELTEPGVYLDDKAMTNKLLAMGVSGVYVDKIISSIGMNKISLDLLGFSEKISMNDDMLTNVGMNSKRFDKFFDVPPYIGQNLKRWYQYLMYAISIYNVLIGNKFLQGRILAS